MNADEAKKVQAMTVKDLVGRELIDDAYLPNLRTQHASAMAEKEGELAKLVAERDSLKANLAEKDAKLAEVTEERDKLVGIVNNLAEHPNAIARREAEKKAIRNKKAITTKQQEPQGA